MKRTLNGGSRGTISQLAGVQGGALSHEANFRRILPGAMAKLVQQGFFEPWEGTYRITSEGQKYLDQIEKDK